ncbi:MAG: Kelch repeat-containing protein [Candidatus Eiseniibacteriota bacterium]
MRALPLFVVHATLAIALGAASAFPVAAAGPAWTRLVPPGPPTLPAEPPSPRSMLGAVYDPVRDRMLVHSGQGPAGLSNDVWELALAGSMKWRRLLPASGPAGPRRTGEVAVYDPVRDRMIVFGGETGGTLLTNEVWTFSLAEGRWAPLAVAAGAAPTARSYASGIYDPLRDRLVIYGGLDQSGLPGDAWTLTLTGTPTWRLISTPGLRPLARDRAACAYDPVPDRMIVFGGRVIGAFTGDTWALEFAGGSFIWRQLAGALPGPSPRMSAAAVFDAARNRFLVSGGWDFSDRSDTWELLLGGTIPEWRLLHGDAPGDSAPAGRAGHVAVIDAARDRMILFAGFDGTGAYRNDVWQLGLAEPAAWAAVTPDLEAQVGFGPTPRFGAVLAADSEQDRMILFGGIDDGFGEVGTTLRNDLWKLTLDDPEWSEIEAPGARPAGRFDAAGAYDPLGDRFLVFGGETYVGAPLRDLWQYAFAGAGGWEDVTPAEGLPSQRAGARLVYDAVGGRMLLFGGWSGIGYLNDVWSLSLGPEKPSWLRVFTSGAPPSPRRDAGVTFDTVRNRLIVTGGVGTSGYAADTWALDVSRPGQAIWQFLHSGAGGPGGRQGLGAAFDWRRNRLVVFGGADGTFHNDAWALSLAGPAVWSPLAPAGEAPGPRWLHGFALDSKRDRVVAFGGRGDFGELFGDTQALVLDLTDPAEGTPRIGGPGSSRSVVVVPGPALLGAELHGGALAVRLAPVAGERARIAVYTVTGRRCASLEIEDPAEGAQEVVLPVAGAWTPGIYFVELAQATGRQVKKIAIAR